MRGKLPATRKRTRAHDSDSESESEAAADSKFNIRVLDNTVFFNEDVSRESIFRLNLTLRKLEKTILARSACLAELLGAESDAAGKFAATTPIHLHVTTDGGLVDAAMSCVDCIKSLKVPVVTVVDGFVASAGTLITLAGSRRIIQPNAKMLIHQLRTGAWGKHAEIVDHYENCTRTMGTLIDFYVAHTKLKRKRLEKILQRDVEWDAAECLQNGLADEVATPKGSAADEDEA